MKKRKIAFMVDRSVEKMEETGDGVRATIGPAPFAGLTENKKVKDVTLDVEKVLVCIGRLPNCDGPGLVDLGVRMDEKGWITVNDRMETSVPSVYAIGDVLGPSRIMLAHVASTEGRFAAENAMGGDNTMDYSVVPNVVFTIPEVASVGLTEDQAREQGRNIRAHTALFRHLGKAQVTGEIAGQVKIVWDAEDGRVLGVHIVGPHAGDLIAEGTLAVQQCLPVRALAETIHAHPTLAEIMAEVSFKALGTPIHG
jgi:dihydrolipoamide dehydrogenase